MIRITIACPKGLTADANALASVLGNGPEDARTFGDARWQNQGALFALASQDVGEGWLEAVINPLTAPDWSADVPAATRAQAVLQLWRGGAPDPAPEARSDVITILADIPAQEAVALLGVVPLDDAP